MFNQTYMFCWKGNVLETWPFWTTLNLWDSSNLGNEELLARNFPIYRTNNIVWLMLLPAHWYQSSSLRVSYYRFTGQKNHKNQKEGEPPRRGYLHAANNLATLEEFLSNIYLGVSFGVKCWLACQRILKSIFRSFSCNKKMCW